MREYSSKAFKKTALEFVRNKSHKSITKRVVSGGSTSEKRHKQGVDNSAKKAFFTFLSPRAAKISLLTFCRVSQPEPRENDGCFYIKVLSNVKEAVPTFGSNEIG